MNKRSFALDKGCPCELAGCRSLMSRQPFKDPEMSNEYLNITADHNAASLA